MPRNVSSMMGTNDCENNWNQHCHWTCCVRKPQPRLHGQPGRAVLHCSDLQMNLLLEAGSPLSWDFVLFILFEIAKYWCLPVTTNIVAVLFSAHDCHLLSWKWNSKTENAVKNVWEVKVCISSCRVQNIKQGSNYSKTKPYKPTKVTRKAILK